MAKRTDFTVAVQRNGETTTETRGSTSRTYSHAIVGTLTAAGRQSYIEDALARLAKARTNLTDCEARLTEDEKADHDFRMKYSGINRWSVSDEEWATVCAELGIEPMVTPRWGGEQRRNSDGFSDATGVYYNAYHQIEHCRRAVPELEELVVKCEALVVGTQQVDGWAGRADLASKRVHGQKDRRYSWAAVASLTSNGAAELRETVAYLLERANAQGEASAAQQIADGELVASEITTEQLAQALEVLAAE